MKPNAKRVARLSLLAAMGVVLLLLAGWIPAGRLVLIAAASFPVCAALMMYGRLWALGVFLVITALGGLILPGTPALAYGAFFGYYPILKSLLERIRGDKLVWVLKFSLYAVVFVLYAILAKAVIGTGLGGIWPVLFLAGGAAFFVYDRCYSILIRFYIEKIARYFP